MIPESQRHTGLWPRYEPRCDRDPADFPDAWLSASEWIGTDRETAEAFFRHCGVGPRRKLSQIGMALQMKLQWPKGRHSMPNKMCIRDLKNAPGWERWEKLGEGRKPAGEDIPMAYTQHSRKLPCGTSRRALGEPTPEMGVVTWFMRCTIRLPEIGPCRLGLFPMKADYTGPGSGNWPRGQGEYEAWIWQEICEDIRDAGGTVEPIEGWCWTDFTEDLSEWADHMVELRETAPGGWHGRVGHLVKHAANKSIGLHGCGYLYERTVDLWEPGDRPVLTEPDEDGHRWISEKGRRLVEGRRTMVHWQRYIAMAVSRAVRVKAEAYLRIGKRVWSIELDNVRIA